MAYQAPLSMGILQARVLEWFAISFSRNTSSGGSDSKVSAYNIGNLGSIPGSEDPLEKEMATHSSTLAWKIPWMEERGRL